MLLSGAGAAVAWALLAIACSWAGSFFDRFTLQIHGGVYLLVGLAASGAMTQAAQLLLGSRTWPVSPEWALWSGVAAAAICYVLGRKTHAVVRLVEAGVLVWFLGALTAGLSTYAYHGIAGAAATHAYCATLRTSVLSIGALLLAWAGARYIKPEFSRLVYPVMLMGAWRIVGIDLHQDRTTALFLSLLLYGAALILLPRIVGLPAYALDPRTASDSSKSAPNP
jgi:hypothetical protein